MVRFDSVPRVADIIGFELPRDRPDSSSPLRVVHLITDLELAGAEGMLARLVEAFAGTGVENAVVSLTTLGQLGDRIANAGIPVFSLGMRPGRPDPRRLWRLIRLVRQLRPAVVQTWLYHADFAGLLAATLTRVPVVWNIRCAELDPRDSPRSQPTLLRALALASRYPAAVICNSKAGRRAHEQLGYTPRRWMIIPNGFDTDAFRPSPEARHALRRELGLDDDAVLVGRLARFHPMKDHATFLRAARAVSDVRPDVHFVAAGRNLVENAAIAELLRTLRLGDRVHLLAERPAARFLASLDLAVSSSAYGEGFPNVVAESMACGVPCVVTDVGDSASIVGDVGVVVPPRDPEALAGGIVRLLQLGAAAREALGRVARQRVVDDFSLERAADRYEELYREIAGGPAVRPADA